MQHNYISLNIIPWAIATFMIIPTISIAQQLSVDLLNNNPYGVHVIGAQLVGVYSESPVGVQGISNFFEGAGVSGRGSGQQSNGILGISNASLATAVRGTCLNIDGWGGHFSGGKGLYVNPRLGVNNADPQHPIHVGTADDDGNGAHLTAGGTWTNGSSRDFKKDFQDLDRFEILDKIHELPIYKWQYRNSDEGYHIGPMAEDFATLFQLGKDPQYISTVDADGIALTAIQGLYDLLQKQQLMIRELQNKIEALQK